MLTHYNIIFNFNGIDIFIFLLKNYIKVEAFLLLESKGNCAFKKARKVKGEGKPTFSTRSFPLSLRPSPLPCGDRGNPPTPVRLAFLIRNRHSDYRIQRKLNSGALA